MITDYDLAQQQAERRAACIHVVEWGMSSDLDLATVDENYLQVREGHGDESGIEYMDSFVRSVIEYVYEFDPGTGDGRDCVDFHLNPIEGDEYEHAVAELQRQHVQWRIEYERWLGESA